MREFVIGANDAGQRADRFLLKAAPALPKALLYKAFRKRDIKCGGRRVEAGYFLREGDVLRVYLPEDCFERRERTFEALPAPEYLYEDAQIGILRKPAGLSAHGSRGQDTLAGRFVWDLIQKGEYDPKAENAFVPALCNRLDRNTQGLVIGAKTAFSLRTVNEMIRNGFLTKRYLCVTYGVPEQPRAVLRAYLRRREGESAEISDTPREGFREIVTEYECLSARGGTALLRVTLHTGRTHQIRAQLADVGLPVLGDFRYGDYAANARYGVKGQLLAAYEIAFDSEPDHCPLENLRGKRFSYEPDFARAYRGEFPGG